MKVAVRYQSRGGNTKEVAAAIAIAAGVTSEPIDVPLDEGVDVLFVGGGVYAHTIDPSLANYLETLSPDVVKSIAAFTTGAGMSATDKIAGIARKMGISVCAKTLPIKKGLHNYRVFGGKGDPVLSDKHHRLVNDFVKEVCAEICDKFSSKGM
jgi:Flavodoxins